MQMTKLTIASLLFVFALTSCKNNADTTRAERDSAWAKLSDEEKRLSKNAVAGLETAEGLQTTLFASEPMMGNPTSIDVDARGRVWVCEAFNYRPQLNPENPQREEGDRILILEDNNGDGKADTAKVFYQGTDVNAALGIAVLGNKVIVSCSPNVFVFTDTDGDDKADKKEVFYTNLGGEQHDHAVHSFTFGPDGKLYFNYGNAGEQLMDKDGKPVIDKDGNVVNAKGYPYRQGMVFRVNEDGTGLEVLAHNFRNNYEAAVDSYGTIWQTDNDDDGNQSTRVNYVMQYGNYGYTNELTGAGWRARRTNMEAEIPQRHWHQNDPGSIPNLLINGAGSPAGLAIYEGNLLPAAFQNGMIHCEAGQNSVRAYPVTPDGAGYKAEVKPLLEGVRDQWFRPVDVCVAPDGSLFVADWYDPGVGGHQMGDMNRGRIYRIAPNDAAYKVPSFDLKSPEGAVQALQSPNMATRYLAWHSLQNAGTGAEAALQKLWNGDNQRMRARAFWLLANMPGTGASYIQTALQDKNIDIRVAAVRAAVQTQPDFIPFLKTAVKDNSAQVRREAALALRHHKSTEAANLWTELAMQYDGADRWYLEALGIGADKQWDAFLTAYQQKAGEQMSTKASRDIVWRARTPMALPLLASNITNDQTASADRAKYFRAFDFIDHPSKEKTLLALLDNNGPHKAEIVITVLNQLDSSSIARSPKVKTMLDQVLPSIKGSQQFVDLVGRYKIQSQNEALYQLALSQPDSSIGAQAATLLLKQNGSNLLKQGLNSGNEQTASAVVKVLGRAGNQEATAMMQAVISDKTYKQPVREAAVRTLGDGWGGSEVLLNMVKAGKLPQELEPAAATTFASAYRKDIRQEALKYFSASTTGGKPLPPISELVKQSGDVAVGKQVFARSCATCHQAAGQGANFGPALSQIGSKLAKDALYVAIIHPDAGISFGYEGYVFKLKDGSTLGGVIASETEDAVEVMIPGGIKKRYSRSEILSRKQMENSMMPSNLHQTMTQQELISLVEFLMAQKGAEKQMANR